MNGTFETEAAFVRDALRKLRNAPNVHVRCDVPLLGRCVDMIYSRGNHIIAVEFKMRDWKRGASQAFDHLLAADYSYVCIPQRRLSGEMIGEFRQLGIGLKFYDRTSKWPFRVAIPARKSKETWHVARAQLWALLTATGQ